MNTNTLEGVYGGKSPDSEAYGMHIFGVKVGEMFGALNGINATYPLDLWMARLESLATNDIRISKKYKLIDVPVNRKALKRANEITAQEYGLSYLQQLGSVVGSDESLI